MQRQLRITGDGNVVGDGSESTVIKQQGGDYAVQIGQLSLTLSPEALHALRNRYVPPEPPDPDGPTPAPGDLPPGSRLFFQSNANFTGRQVPLRRLARAPLHGDGAALITQAVQGMGGVGKTQMAVGFAHRYGRYFHGVHPIACGIAVSVGGQGRVWKQR